MPHGNRPPSTDPFHSLLDNLRDLQIRISDKQGRTGTTIEMYDSFVRGSEFGRECQYSSKALALFKLNDYNDLKDMILKLAAIFNEIEGKK